MVLREQTHQTEWRESERERDGKRRMGEKKGNKRRQYLKQILM